MPTVYFHKGVTIQVPEGYVLEDWREDLDGTTRIEIIPSRNKPLAPGKPSKRGAKGKPAKAGVKARKGTRKK